MNTPILPSALPGLITPGSPEYVPSPAEWLKKNPKPQFELLLLNEWRTLSKQWDKAQREAADQWHAVNAALRGPAGGYVIGPEKESWPPLCKMIALWSPGAPYPYATFICPEEDMLEYLGWSFQVLCPPPPPLDPQ